jgi:hypothetical protein
MDDRKANIDLAFRNGLKDFEVLPPPDVWNCIESRIMRKKKPVYLMRAAAFLAIAMTMSILAYRWTGKTTTAPVETILALNEESSVQFSPDNLVADPVVQIKPQSESAGSLQAITFEDPQVISQIPVNDTVVSTIAKLPYTNLRSPLKPASLDIIHHQNGFNGQQINNLTADALNQEYQDYLADNSTTDQSGRWSIAALATPTYYGKINSGSDELSKQIMASEQSVISYSGGVALAYNVNKRFSIQSGLFYSSVGQEIDGINSYAGFQKYDNTKGDHNFEVLTTNGTVFTDNADVFLFAGNSERIITNYNNDVFDPQKASLDYISNTMRQDFSYLELPVFLRYKLIDRVVDFNLIGGLSYNLLLDNSVYTVIDGNKYMIGTTEGLNMFSLSSSLGMGMEYKFSEKLSLNLEPTFRYYLNTFNNVAGSNFHPYSFGIFSGISYKF